MKENKDMPAYPCVKSDVLMGHMGLTKLEKVSVILLAGMLANKDTDHSGGDVVAQAVSRAKELLDVIDKEKEDA